MSDRINWNQVLATAAIAISMAGSTPLGAQTDNSTTEEPNQPRAVTAIHRLTKSARTSNDYSTIIDRCAETMAGSQLAESDREYLARLASWAYNRRCDSRMEAAEYFARAGLTDQAVALSDEALGDAIQSIEHDPSRWQAVVNRGILLARAGMIDDAMRDFLQVARQQPESTIGWFNVAELTALQGDYQVAIENYDRVLTVDSGDLQALTGRGLAHFHAGRFERALEDFEVVLKWMPGSDAAIINRGDAHLALGHWKQAYDDFVAAVERDDSSIGNTRAAWMMATCPDPEYYRPEMARDLARKVLDRSRPTAMAWEALAAAAAALGDFESAVASQSKAVDLCDDRVQAAAEARLDLYRRGEPYRLTANAAPADSAKLN